VRWGLTSARLAAECQEALQLLAAGIHVEADRSGHGIQDDEPALVEMAIHFVLDRVRAQR
jgi:hypothetical protein